VRDRGCDGAALFREFIAGRKDDAGVPQGAFRMARALYDFIFLGQFDFHRMICNSRKPQMMDPAEPIALKTQIGFLPKPTHLYLAASFADLMAAGLRKTYRKPAKATPTIAKAIGRSFRLTALRVLFRISPLSMRFVAEATFEGR
jgi:hypothetical protein